jgi:hypothetical protein
MSALFTARRPSAAAALALDLGLQVRIETHPEQRPIFASAEELPVQRLVSELSLLVSELRVRSFALRYELEEVTSALQRNAECGFWPQARRAALDLSGVLSLARRRRLADPELCLRGSNGALRVAELCAREAR